MNSGPGITDIFVGRQRELAVMEKGLNDALSGRGRVVMLAGEPGIGKTRLTQELASNAESLGAQVLWGRGYEQEGAPPYWPWVQPLRSYVEDMEPEQLRSEMGAEAADIAQIIPEVRLRLPELAQSPPLQPEEARFRLFDSISVFLKHASQTKPLLVVLEDLHWADRSSLLLLEFLAKEVAASPVLLVGTYRDSEVSRRHPLSECLAQLSRESTFQRFLLRGLSYEDTLSFIRSSGVEIPPESMVENIFSQTDGNPFFLTEIMRLLPDHKDATAADAGDSWGFKIPEGIRDAIGQRLNGLSDLCNEVLTIASVIGKEFDFRVLTILTEDMTDEGTLRSIEEATRAHLIEAVPGQIERYRFSHALVQQTLYEEQTSSRTLRMHARIGEAMEEIYRTILDDHAAEIAYHFAEAEPLLGAEKLVRYSLLAGERALAAYAHQEALVQFERARPAVGTQPSIPKPAQNAEEAALLFGIGRAQAATLPRHEIQQAVDSLSGAFEYYARAGDPVMVVAVALCPISFFPGRRTGMARLISRALEMVDPDSREAGHLQSRYGCVLGIEEGDYERASEPFASALSAAKYHGDTILELGTLVDSAQVDLWHLRLQESVNKGQRAIELARQADDPRTEVDAQLNTARAAYMMGQSNQAKVHGEASLGPAERVRDQFLMTRALATNENVARVAGNWSAARDFSDRGMEVSPLDANLLATRAMLEYELGDFSRGEGYLARLSEIARLTDPGRNLEPLAFSAVVIGMVAIKTGVTKEFDVAENAAHTYLSSPSATPVFGDLSRAGLALLAIHQGDADTAREQYSALTSREGTMLIGGMACVDRLLGLLCVTLGNLDQAAVHFEGSLAFCRMAGYRPDLAWTCHDYAEVLLQRQDPGDSEKALSLIDESLAISSDLGMRPLMERAEAVKERLRSGPVTTPTYPDGLSQREIDVLQLICAGKTDREIGENLFISVKTVSHHVGNILNKTNTANRTEAATYAAINGITVAPGPTSQ